MNDKVLRVVMMIYMFTLTFILLLQFLKDRFMKIENVTNNLAKNPNKSYGTRNLSMIEYIIWHHSATSSGSAESFASYHVSKNEWPGIGYHFVIEQDGTIKQTNELTTLSYHCPTRNTDGIGVCLVGNFSKNDLTAEQEQAANWLGREIRKMVGKNLVSAPHGDFKQTSCPGDKIRNKVYNW